MGGTDGKGGNGRKGWKGGKVFFLCVLCLQAVLSFEQAPLVAQQGGFAMPDPKTMSGIPRPVDDLPNGAISVGLIRGSLSKNQAGRTVDLHVGP